MNLTSIINLASRVFGGESRATKELSNPQDPSYWVSRAWGAGQPYAGVAVDERSALTFTAVMAAVRVLSETLGTVPAILYRRLPGGGKERATDHPVYNLIHNDPNDEMVPVQFKSTLMSHIATWGNGYAEIERTGRGLPGQIWPITPDRVMVDRDGSGRLVYDVAETRGPNVVMRPENVLHIPGLGFDGVIGYSPIRMAAQAVGLGLAAETFGASFFANGSRPSGVLKMPAGRTLTDKARATLRDGWTAAYSGVANTGKTPVLEDGTEWQSLTIPPEDAQFLETRKFQVNEVARMFGVPPHKLGDLERATFSNIEHQSIEFVTDTMLPWFTRWEQWLGKRLLTREERQQGYFVEFLLAGLLRGDAAARAAFYKTLRDMGVLNADEIREAENLNPLPNGQGKVYLVPLNMVDSARAADNAPAVADARRKVIAEAVGRIVRKEANAFRRAAKKPETFRASMDEFLADHEDHVRQVIEPLLGAFGSADPKWMAGAYLRVVRMAITADGLREDQLREWDSASRAESLAAHLVDAEAARETGE